VTTTTIRTLVETTASQMMDNGAITKTQRTAIMNINGHSSQTTEDYYLLRDRWTDAKNGREMFNAIVSNLPAETPMTTENMDALPGTPPHVLSNPQFSDVQMSLSPWSRSSPVAKPWGILHPVPSTSETGATPRRVQWSPDELDYIAAWVEENEGDSRDNQVSRCLAKIRSDPTARGMWHRDA
jgi:hypothetical protein